MTDYFGSPKAIIRLYLMGTLSTSINIRKKYIAKTGADSGNFTSIIKLVKELDKIFNTLSAEEIKLLRLRYVELLSTAETAKLTRLSVYQITAKTSKTMKKVKNAINSA